MRWDLRPTDWHKIWPELRERPDAPPIPSTSASQAEAEVLIPSESGCRVSEGQGVGA